MRKALVTIAVVAALSIPVAVMYVAVKALQLLALGLLFLTVLAVIG